MNDPHAEGRRYLAEGRPAEAHACLIRAAALCPDDLSVRDDLAQALFRSGRADEAAPLFRDLVARKPDNPAYRVDLGRALRAAGAFAEALAVYRAALALLPGEPVLYNNIGNCLLALGQTGAAIVSFRRAIAERPDFADAHYNLGLALLTDGQMEEGWREHRWRLRHPAHFRGGWPIDEWDGAPMPGKVLLVRCEQGLGDTIQFCRYLPLIAPRARVVAEVQPPLVRLLSGLPGIETIVAVGDPLPRHDAVCSLMSLPRVLGGDEKGEAGYLRADAAAVGRWIDRLRPLPSPKIGLVWAGGAGLGASVLADRRRSLLLQAFASLRGPTFISLQKGPASAEARQPPAGMALIDWTGELHDFADTAALVAALDLVITVDTAVAHLAGAMDCPVWMLNRTDTDWRWGVSGQSTGWYPSLRIFRQTVSGDWSAPMSAIAAGLREPKTVRAGLSWARTALAAKRPADAEARLREISRERPDHPGIAEIHAALGFCLLSAGRWVEAWPEWAWRYPAATWDGSAMPGQTLLLHADTAADVLLFGRYVAPAARRSGARIVVSVPSSARRLAMGWADVTAPEENVPPHDRACSFGLLPGLFASRIETVPDTGLCPSPPLSVLAFWSGRVSRLRGLRVGVAFDDPALLSKLARKEGVNLVALTPEITPAAEPGTVVHDWSAELRDLASTAGLIAQLDMVVAANNDIAHLACALGRPVWLPPRATSHWPWLPGREDNPWYPTARQFGADADIVTELARMNVDTPEDQTFAYGNDRYRLGDFLAAATGFRQTLALRPDHLGALGNLVATLLNLRRMEAAVRFAELAVQMAPHSHPLRLRLGLALLGSRRFADAAACLRQALALNPEDAETVAALEKALAGGSV